MNHVGRHGGYHARESYPVASGFNPADTFGSDITYDSFNDRALFNVIAGGGEAVRSLRAYTTGKWYFEAYVGPVSTNRVQLGIATTAALSGGLSQSAGGVATIPSGLGTVNGSGSAGVGAWNTANMAWDNGIILRVAFDVPNRLAWFLPINGLAPGWNNNASADPASGAFGLSINGTGALYIGAQLSTVGGDALPKWAIINQGDLGFVGAIPTGYSRAL